MLMSFTVTLRPEVLKEEGENPGQLQKFQGRLGKKEDNIE